MIGIVGSSGQLGSALIRVLPGAIPLPRSVLDLSKPNQLRTGLEEIHCDTLINCAAYTAVDRAETDESAARLVNAESVGVMAAWAQERSTRFVTISTDYVFDGLKGRPYVESDETNPMTAYGRTKLAGEQLALAANPDCLILRTAWLMSGTHRNFISTILGLAKDGPVSVVDDQRGSPTFANDLAIHTVRLLESQASGIVHATNQGSTTWFGLARAAAVLAGIDPERIQACSTEEFPRPARRPANSVLVSERYAGVEPMPPWKASLPEVVAGVLSWN